MPRIRSVHPGQWVDEGFVSCSSEARLLAIAVRNFADDNGIFQWQPVKLKMLCFPNDTCDVALLLQELIETKQVHKYETENAKYGIIRNFLLFQSPQKGNGDYPLPPEPVGKGYPDNALLIPYQYRTRNRRVQSGKGKGEGEGEGEVIRAGAGGDDYKLETLSGFSSSAVALTKYFLALRKEHWPEYITENVSIENICEQAERMLGLGYDSSIIEHALDVKMAAAKRDGATPPGNIHAYELTIKNAVHNHQSNMQDGTVQ